MAGFLVVTPVQPPVAPRRPRALEAHGDQRVDPYYWLREREDPEVRAYLEAENAYADDVLSPVRELEQRAFAEIVGAVVETDASDAVRWGDWWYYERTFEGMSYPIHCRRPAGDEAYPPDLDAPGEEVVLDENALAAGREFCSVGILTISPDHRLVAVGADFEGTERHELWFATLDGGRGPDERLTDIYYGAVFSTDASSLLYLRTDAAWRPHQLWRHVLDTDPSTDVLVYEEHDERFRLSVSASRDGAMILLHVSSSMTTEVFAVGQSPSGPLESVWRRAEGVECAIEHVRASDGSSWWAAVTNEEARDFRLLAAPRGGEFREVLAHRPGTRLDGVDAFATHVVLSERLEGEPVLRIVPLAFGVDPFEGDLLARSAVVGAELHPAATELGANKVFDTTAVRVMQSTLLTRGVAYDVDLVDRTRIERKRTLTPGFDPDDYVTARVWIPARDGTQVPVSLAHHRDLLEPDADPGQAPRTPAPLLLYGYGAYETSIDPTFSPARVPLLTRGVIWAVAHVRGGGELGRAWYEQGRLERKATTFTDYVDVARGLIDRGWTDPSRLVGLGASAGGLLMGAAVNDAPELFRVVVAMVPFVDCLTTMSDPSLPLTVGEWEEWGDPVHDADAYWRMKSWSPLDNVVAAGELPELFVTGGLNDTRVSYWEPAKWVATLRERNPGAKVILKTELDSGHAGPSGRYDYWREYAMIYSFVLDRLGLTSAGDDLD